MAVRGFFVSAIDFSFFRLYVLYHFLIDAIQESSEIKKLPLKRDSILPEKRHSPLLVLYSDNRVDHL